MSTPKIPFASLRPMNYADILHAPQTCRGELMCSPGVCVFCGHGMPPPYSFIAISIAPMLLLMTKREWRPQGRHSLL